MKKILFGLSAIWLMMACGQPPKEFILTGKLDNCTLSEIYLINGTEQDTVKVAADGTFEVRRTFAESSLGALYSEDPMFFATLLLVNGTQIHVTADLERPMETLSYTGPFQKAYQLNQKINLKLEELNEATFDDFQSLYGAWAQFIDSADVELKALGNADYQRLEKQLISQSAANMMTGYQRLLKERGLPLDSDADYNNYMESTALTMNADISQVIAYLNWKVRCTYPGEEPSMSNLVTLAQQKISDATLRETVMQKLAVSYFANGADAAIEQIYQLLDKEINDGEFKTWMTETYEKQRRFVPGAAAIDCYLTAPDGSKVRLSSLYGKLLYLDIWATWCGPCCEEIPYLEELVKRFMGDKRIEFVSVSIDRSEKDWKKKLDADCPAWKQFRCEEFASLYGIAGIPAFILIDREGKIITMKAPRPSDEQCENTIRTLLE